MQIEIRDAPVTEDVSALELPLRLSVQLADELQLLDVAINNDYCSALQRLRRVRDTITSISISIQNIHDGIISDLVLLCGRLETENDSRQHSNSEGYLFHQSNIQQHLR